MNRTEPSMPESLNRRSLLTLAGAAGLGMLGAAWKPAFAANNGPGQILAQSDLDILNAAKIAEALAVTMYTGIIDTAPFFTRLPDDDQNYFRAAQTEEMSHYRLLVLASDLQPSPFTTFYFPKNMFTDAKTTLDTLVTLEDAFIAAYLIGVQSLQFPDYREVAARIMGIESDHRTLGRVAASDVATQDGGPITTLKGLAGVEEPIDPPNNNGYERTFNLASIADAVTALMPFLSMPAAAAAGFDTSKPFTFAPFEPTLPSDLGDLGD